MSQITLTIASRLEDVPLLGDLISALCLRAGMIPLDANGVEVCVVEAVNNAIKHAYRGEPFHSVDVSITWLSDELTFDVWDSGRSGDAARINKDHSRAFDLDLDNPETMPESGRGLAIIQQVMDSFEYIAGTERNRFHLTKRLNC